MLEYLLDEVLCLLIFAFLHALELALCLISAIWLALLVQIANSLLLECRLGDNARILILVQHGHSDQLLLISGPDFVSYLPWFIASKLPDLLQMFNLLPVVILQFIFELFKVAQVHSDRLLAD